jgi:hypothetical protein
VDYSTVSKTVPLWVATPQMGHAHEIFLWVSTVKVGNEGIFVARCMGVLFWCNPLFQDIRYYTVIERLFIFYQCLIAVFELRNCSFNHTRARINDTQ